MTISKGTVIQKNCRKPNFILKCIETNSVPLIQTNEDSIFNA